jgi:hypothetical protein
MAQPLSPLPSSHRNLRTLSPSSPPGTARRRGIDEIIGADNDKENTSPNPAKRPQYDGSGDNQDDLKYATARGLPYTRMDDETVELPPSSPFQYDARNDTVDMARLEDVPVSPTPGRMSFPKKARHFQVDEYEEEIHAEITPDAAVDESGETSGSPMEEEQSFLYQQESGRLDIGHSVLEDRRNEGMSTVCQEDDSQEDSEIGNDAMLDMDNNDTPDPMDDTCLSTFSAVPNVDMTMFAKLRGSPTKQLQDVTNSPARSARASPYRLADPETPGTVKRRGMADVDMSPTPRRQGFGHENDATDLLDFTDSLNYFRRVSQRYSMQSGRISSPRRRSPLKGNRESIRTPGKYNLLDFEIPPAPTPRSIPTITPRELESLKSGFLSEISSLKATLSGKEAEVASLKQAVADAERRVGEALEEVRNEAIRKEALEVQQAEWERRGKEMETILREVRAEIVEGEQERERLTKKAEEGEKRKEQLEGRIVELESQLDAARKAAAEAPGPVSSDSDSRGTKTAEETAREVQDAVEKVARELHMLYKGKHESKVAALKKSYETRWEKRVQEAENKLKDATEEIERLKTERDTTMSGPVNPNASMVGRDSEELEAEKRVLEAQIKGLQQEMVSMKRDNERLHSELKMERTEKGELVAAVDEWLAIQAQNQAQNQAQQQPVHNPHREVSASSTLSQESSSIYHEAPLKEADLVPAPAEPETNLRRSINRSGISGIRPPSSGKPSRLTYANGGHTRANSGGRTGLAMPTPGRSGIMSSIERMGRGGN